MHPMVGNFLVDEVVGDSNVRQKKPEAWVSPTEMGMSKIRASTNTGKYFVDFASSVTVHGFNHLTAPHRHPLERFLTVVFIGAAFICLILLSASFWDRYQHDATIFILERDYRNFKVTTPSVVFCPILRVNKTMFTEIFKRHGIEDTAEAREFFTFIANATYLNMDKTPLYDKVPSEKWLTIIWELKSDPQAEHGIGTAWFATGVWMVTERGLCLGFHSSVAVYANYIYWMQNNWTLVSQPPIPEFGYANHEVGQSFKVERDSVMVSTYHPQEVPEFDNIGVFAGYKETSNIWFTPQEVNSSPEVRALSQSQRRCKTLTEGGLTMWPVYSHNMCILECKYSLIRKDCGCHPFFARPMPGIPVCGAHGLRCIGQHRSRFIKITSDDAHSCGCYHNCDTSFFHVRSIEKSNLQMASALNNTLCTINTVFPPQKVRREVQFSLNDFMASVGGAAGLFLGASVISIVEFFYWATLRLYWYIVNNRRERAAKLEQRQMFYDKMTRGATFISITTVQ